MDDYHEDLEQSLMDDMDWDYETNSNATSTLIARGDYFFEGYGASAAML